MNYDKVIFLDIEGVIVTHRTILDKTTKHLKYVGGTIGWERFIDTGAMSLIWRIAQKYNAVIVLTSTLRYQPLTIPGLLNSLPDWLSLDDALAFLSSEVTSRGDIREEEIRAFITKHKVQRFVVIDDRDLEIEHFVQINAYDGFRMKDYYQAQSYFTDEPIQGEPIFL